MAIHRMKLDKNPFDAIKLGRKTIELRLYDEKRGKIFIGDTIIFQSLESGETLSVTVLDLYIYKSFAELYNHFDKIYMGYQENETANPNDMNKYYTLENQEKFGVVGIEISLNG